MENMKKNIADKLEGLKSSMIQMENQLIKGNQQLEQLKQQISATQGAIAVLNDLVSKEDVKAEPETEIVEAETVEA